MALAALLAAPMMPLLLSARKADAQPVRNDANVNDDVSDGNDACHLPSKCRQGLRLIGGKVGQLHPYREIQVYTHVYRHIDIYIYIYKYMFFMCKKTMP